MFVGAIADPTSPHPPVSSCLYYLSIVFRFELPFSYTTQLILRLYGLNLYSTWSLYSSTLNCDKPTQGIDPLTGGGPVGLGRGSMGARWGTR